MAEFLAFLGAIPKLIGLIREAVDLWKKYEMNLFINDLEKAIEKTKKAKSTEERYDAALDLVRLFKRAG